MVADHKMELDCCFLRTPGDRIRPEAGRGRGKVRLHGDRVQEGRREVAVQDDPDREEPTAKGHRRGKSLREEDPSLARSSAKTQMMSRSV